MFTKWSILPLILLLTACITDGHNYQCANYAPTQNPSLKAQSPETSEMEEKIFQSINSIRKKKGLQALKQNEKLALIARKYSFDMASKNFFSHISPNGETLEQRADSFGKPYKSVGENLFKTTNIKAPLNFVIKGWMESPGHRKNILRPQFTETGVGVWQKENEYYFTQIFMKPLLN